MEILVLLYFSLLLAILIHETGHLLAVIISKHKATEFAVGPIIVKHSETGYSINLRASLLTGIVAYQRPLGEATWASELLIISSGVIANFVIGGTLAIYYHFASSNGLIAITGWASVLIGILNLFPTHIKKLKLDSDARRFLDILKLRKETSKSKKYDLSAPNAQVKIKPSSTVNSGKVQLEILNDDLTPMDFVVDTLKTYLNFNDFSAILLTLSIHQDGGAKLGWLDHEVAKMVSEQINNEARIRGFPFHCRVLGTVHESLPDRR